MIDKKKTVSGLRFLVQGSKPKTQNPKPETRNHFHSPSAKVGL